LILPFKLLLFPRSRTDEPGGPPLFEPSLKIEGDIGHLKPTGLSAPVHRTINAQDHLKVRQVAIEN
jgi:hypothetical protein